MQKAILTGYKLTQDPAQWKDRNGRNYYIFSVVSIRPGKNGNHLTCDCCVRDAWMVQKMERMKLHQGSCVDVTAEISAYTDKNGNGRVSFEVSEISFAEFGEMPQNNAAVTPEQKHAEQEKIISKKSAMLMDMLCKENFTFQ